MSEELFPSPQLLNRVSRAQYDASRKVLRANGWCLSLIGTPRFTIQVGDRFIDENVVLTGEPRPDVPGRYPGFDNPNCGWSFEVPIELDDGAMELYVTAQAGAEKARAIRPLERIESDPYYPDIAMRAHEEIDALRFIETRGIHTLQRYVHRFGNNVVNSFDINAWARATNLATLGVRLVVWRGHVTVSLRHLSPEGRVAEIAHLVQQGPGTCVCPTIKLSEFQGAFVPFVAQASDDAEYDIVFVTDDAPTTPHAKINYVFCTYKRPEYVQHNTNVFRDFLKRNKAARSAHLTIIDNGSQDGNNDCGVTADARVTVLPNNNTGGAGGFGRGIYEACYGVLADKNFTHVCLLDDDIYLDPEMFARNGAMVQYLKPGFHIGAPMYPTSSPDGAPRKVACFGHKFRGTTHPSDTAIGSGLDTGDPAAFIKMNRKPDSTGWWWDCIAVRDIHRIGLPYPFFIKMDDVEYSLRLRDAGVKLVIPFSFWVLHDDFEEKYSAAMQYFRFRNRWVLLAQLDRIEPTAFREDYTRLVRNFVAQRKYEHAQLLLDAMAHFLKGPEYLVAEASRILSGVFQNVKHEKNVAMPEPPEGAQLMNDLATPASPRTEWLNRLTVNNHFIPLKERIALDTTRPVKVTDARRSKTVSYWNAEKGVGYTVTRNSTRAVRQIARLRVLRSRMRGLPKVLAQYREVVPHLTSQGFWATYGKFGQTPRLARAQRDTEALRDLHREVARLHIELQHRGALSDHENRGVTKEDTAFLNALRNRYQGQRCFVMGNGPSLTVADMELLRDEVTFAANKIYLAFGETNWRPTFYSVEDVLVAKNNATEIQGVEGTTKIFPHHMLQYLPRRPNHHYARWLPPADNRSPFREFSTDLAKGICWGSTITYSMIQMAVHMGFRDIYILGLDHSYVEPKTKADGALVSEGERNHFHPDYRKKGEKWHYPVLDRLETSYQFAKDYCDSIDVRIYNASRFTKLDIFPRVDLDDVLGHKPTVERVLRKLP